MNDRNPKTEKRCHFCFFDTIRPKKFFIKRCVVLNKSFVKTFFVSWLKDTRVWLRLIFLQLWLQDGLDGWQLPHVFFRHWQRKEEISNFFHPIGQVTLFAFLYFLVPSVVFRNKVGYFSLFGKPLLSFKVQQCQAF